MAAPAVAFTNTLLANAADMKKKNKSCILLWMNGGPSQMDTFDLKPGHANGGTFKEIATKVPGIRISEHLPQIARHVERMALVRSMSTKEADHGRAAGASGQTSAPLRPAPSSPS